MTFPGLILIDISQTSHAVQQKTVKRGREIIVKTVDRHPALTKKARQLVGKVDHICRTAAVGTASGWIIHPEKLPTVEDNIAVLLEQGAELNEKASKQALPLRVSVGVVVASPLVPALAESFVDDVRLNGMRDVLDIVARRAFHDRIGQRSPWKPAIARLRNVEDFLAPAVAKEFEQFLAFARRAREVAIEKPLLSIAIESYVIQMRAIAKELGA